MISSVTKGGTILAALLTSALCVGQEIQVQVNGDAVTFPDVTPRKIGVVVMVPLRAVCEKMGATVGWDPTTQTVTCNSAGSDIVLHIGDTEATVNGQMRNLDLPPMVISDRTLVPMSFFGDSTGNAITWNGDANLLAISTSSTTTTTSTLRTPPPTVLNLDQNEVVPVTLNTSLSSTTSQVGDTFTATVVSNGTDGYANIPEGTKIEGHVAAVEPMENGNPAILDLAFDRLVLPNGTAETLDGSLASLDNEYAMVGDDGVYRAQNSGKTYERMVFAGYRSSDGTLLGVNDSQPIDATVLPNLIGGFESQLSEDEHPMTDISLPVGTEFGIRINAANSINL